MSGLMAWGIGLRDLRSYGLGYRVQDCQVSDFGYIRPKHYLELYKKPRMRLRPLFWAVGRCRQAQIQVLSPKC